MAVDASSSGRLAGVSGAVLTGGASRRMGRDKAHLVFPPGSGAPLATRTARLLERLLEDVLLVGGEPPADAPGRRVPDGEGPRCALRGLVAALAAARGERVLVLATDMPRLTPDLLLGLLAFPPADAVVPRTADGVHPLCAVYLRERVLPTARTRLAAGDLALQALLADLDVGWLEGRDLHALDPDTTALTNLNTPGDGR